MKIKLVRGIYDWVLSWAEKPSARTALFAFSFAESSFFPIPVDILLIPLVLGDRKNWWKLALLTSTASVLGGMFGYLVGWKLWWTASHEFTGIAEFFFRIIPGFSEELFAKIQTQYELHNFWIVFTAGFTPIPYKVITISAGAFHIQFAMFFLASLISRGARFFLVSLLMFIFGEKIRHFIDRYFNWLALLFTILLIGGFLLIKGVF